MQSAVHYNMNNEYPHKSVFSLIHTEYVQQHRLLFTTEYSHINRHQPDKKEHFLQNTFLNVTQSAGYSPKLYVYCTQMDNNKTATSKQRCLDTPAYSAVRICILQCLTKAQSGSWYFFVGNVCFYKNQQNNSPSSIMRGSKTRLDWSN